MAHPPSATSPPTSASDSSPNMQLPQPQSSSSQHRSCKLRFLMVNGESFHLEVPASSSVQDVKQTVIDKRPKELTEFLKGSTSNAVSGPSKVEEIRILHLGKFLDDNKTLQEYKFATEEEPTAVHIAVKLTANASEDVKEKINKKGSACCAIM